ADDKPLEVAPICRNNLLMHIGVVAFQPGGEGRPQVEADVLKVAGVGVWTVALMGNLLVEVFVGCCARLARDQPSKRIFAWRLVEVAIQRDKLVCAHQYTPDLPRVTPHRASRTAIGREAPAHGMAYITNEPG